MGWTIYRQAGRYSNPWSPGPSLPCHKSITGDSYHVKGPKTGYYRGSHRKEIHHCPHHIFLWITKFTFHFSGFYNDSMWIFHNHYSGFISFKYLFAIGTSSFIEWTVSPPFWTFISNFVSFPKLIICLRLMVTSLILPISNIHFAQLSPQVEALKIRSVSLKSATMFSLLLTIFQGESVPTSDY